MMLTVPIMAIMEGIEDEKDLVSWLMSKPLEFIINTQIMIKGGFGLIIVGVALWFMPQ